MTLQLTRRTVLAAGLSGLALPPLAATDRAWTSVESAVLFGFPIFEFARTGIATAGARPGQPHRFNQLQHARRLLDHRARQITAPNHDTIYSSARLDLTQGPLLVELPASREGYFSIAFMNAFTDNFAYSGTRATAGAGGRALVAGPRWDGVAPTGVRLVRSATDDVWMLGRFLVDSPDGLTAAHQLQDSLRILEAPDAAPPSIDAWPAADPSHFLRVVNIMLARMSLEDPVGRRSRLFAEVGLQPGAIDAFSGLAPALQAEWLRALPSVVRHLGRGFADLGQTLDGWQSPPAGIGAPGDNDLVRATVALSGLAALEEVEATYRRADVDSAGRQLTGAGRYQLRIPAAVPVGAFWSLTAYEIDESGRLFLVANPSGRYAIGSHAGELHHEADGSVRVTLAQADFGGRNWLPTPAGPFALIFRAYLPEPQLLQGRWRLPAVAFLESTT
ncbi:MAG: DUF1254 domain-containing protein, partial [Thermaurantiacus sp.]